MSANEKQVGGEHYRTGDVQHWDLCAARGYDYFQGQITKYIDRWKQKGGLQDLLKAKHFLEKYIEVHEKFLPLPDKTTDDRYAFLEECQAQFLLEGARGDGANLYKCRRCGTHLNAKTPVQAFELHGDCPGRNYVKQE